MKEKQQKAFKFRAYANHIFGGGARPSDVAPTPRRTWAGLAAAGSSRSRDVPAGDRGDEKA